MVSPIPAGYHTITPYLAVRGVSKLIEFVTNAFGAREHQSITLPDGTIKHAEYKIGDSIVMMGDVGEAREPSSSCLYMYVEDVDAVYAKAVEAGAETIMPPQDVFYGDRNCGVTDPLGNMWWISTRVEDVSKDELTRRAAEEAAKEASE